MISHIWTVIARSSIVDSSTNLISLQNILEKIDINFEGKVEQNTQIVIPIDFEIVTLWAEDNTETKRIYNIKTELVNSDKKTTGEFLQTMVLEPGIRRFRSIIKISGLPVSRSGIYHFAISVKPENGEKFPKPVTKIPLEVNISISSIQRPIQS